MFQNDIKPKYVFFRKTSEKQITFFVLIKKSFIMNLTSFMETNSKAGRCVEETNS